MEKISVITVFNDFINFKDLMLYNFKSNYALKKFPGL